MRICVSSSLLFRHKLIYIKDKPPDNIFLPVHKFIYQTLCAF